MTDGLDRSEPARETIDASVVVEILEQQRVEGRHECAQCYVSVGGEPVLDVAIGESIPGRAAPHRRSDALVLVGQAAHDDGRPPTLGARAARARRSRRRLHRRLGQRQGALHAPPRAHPHRRVPDVPRHGPSTRTSRTPRRSAASPPTPPTGSRGRRRRTTRSRAGRSSGRSSRPSTAGRSTGTSARRSSSRSA